MGLILVETGGPHNRGTKAYLAICHEAHANRDTVVFCNDLNSKDSLQMAGGDSVPSNMLPDTISLPVDDEYLDRLARACRDGVAFLPADGVWTRPDFHRVSNEDDMVLPSGMAVAPTNKTGQLSERPVSGWVMSANLAVALLRLAHTVEDLRLPAILDRFRNHSISVRWLSATVTFDGRQPTPGGREDPVIRSDADVLALVPHYQCEDWLEQCLASLVDQTRPPDAIVVVDDASHEAPLDLCRNFPGVTLLQAPERVGPYRLVQSVISQTSFDAYLFQDADDWSACDRLELLLTSAERFGADLIGCQQARLLHTNDSFHTMTFPLDVNWGLAEGPAHGMAHPTSLVARRFLMKTGGFSSGMRFGGDTEFLHRAVLAGRVINTPHLSYFWRGRPESLTNSPDTGNASPIRQKMWETLYRHYRSALANQREGRPFLLEPMCPDEGVELTHLSGPRLF